ncbi:MAG: ABC transporter substrate-binding protein [Candidatus Bathyarchaeia archaeon]
MDPRLKKGEVKMRVFLTFLIALIIAPSTIFAQLKEGDYVVFGVPTALGSIEGRDGWMSVQMAVEEINKKGGIKIGQKRHQIKAYAIDTREHEPGIPLHDALIAQEKLILERKPHAIVLGNFRSEVLLSTMDLIAKYKIPYICSIAMTPLMQKKVVEDYEKYKYTFRNALNAPYLSMYLSKLMEFIQKEFGFSRAYLVVQDTLWAVATGSGLEKWFKENKWDVVGFDKYPLGATDFATSLMKVRAQKADVLIPIFDMPQSGILLKQARAMKVEALPVGFISPIAPENAYEVFEGEVEGFVNLVFEVGPLPVKAVPKSMEYNRNFGKRWGEAARKSLSGHGPGPSYDAVYIMAYAIEKAGTLDPDAIVKALEATDMQGVIGRIKFGKDHQVIFGMDPKEAAIGAAFQWRQGKRIVVFPDVVAEGKIELPPYVKSKK